MLWSFVPATTTFSGSGGGGGGAGGGGAGGSGTSRTLPHFGHLIFLPSNSARTLSLRLQPSHVADAGGSVTFGLAGTAFWDGGAVISSDRGMRAIAMNNVPRPAVSGTFFSRLVL